MAKHFYRIYQIDYPMTWDLFFTRLSAVRKVPETIKFQELGIFETLGSKISHGTSKKVADDRTHLRKVLKKCLFYIKKSLSALFILNRKQIV